MRPREEVFWSASVPRRDRAAFSWTGHTGNETQCLSRSLGYDPVVPPNPNRLKPWEYDKELYKKRNEIEKLFRRLKGFRRIATRYDKLDVIFLAFIVFTLIVEAFK